MDYWWYMNILILGNGTLFIGDQEKMIANEFSRQGHKVFFVDREKEKWITDAEDNSDVITLHIKNNHDLENLFSLDVDVCIGMDQSVVPFAQEFQNRTGIKSYCIFLDFPVHIVDSTGSLDYNFDYAQRFHYWLNCSLDLEGVFFINTASAEEYKKRFKKDPLLIDYAISCEGYLEKFENPSKDFVCGCNRIVRWKGTHYNIQAINKTPYKYIHIYGSGDDKEINNVKMFADQTDNDIEFYHKISDFDKMRYMYNANVFIYGQTCKWIGGLVPIEAGSVKTPSVVFDYQVLRDIYGDSVLYAQPGNISSMRKNIVNLYEDKDMNNELSERIYKLYKDRYTKEKMIKNIINLIGA